MTGELNRRENELEETELNLTELRMKCSIREELQSYDRREFSQAELRKTREAPIRRDIYKIDRE